MNKGNNRRRSSFGRRVSFSAATKVKEFATGDKDYTLWNSTYEEERKNVSSDSSQKSDTDSEVFLAEKTFMMNDEMEMTDVLPTVQAAHPGSSTRNDMTVVGSEEMEVTMTNKTMEKFSVEDANDQEVTMDFTSVVRPASSFAKQLQCSNTDDMEMTSAMIQNISENKGLNNVKPTESSVTTFLSQLKSSSACKNVEDDMEMTKPISMEEAHEIGSASLQKPRPSELNDDNMEITEFLTLRDVSTKLAKNDMENDDMEMTKSVCYQIDSNQFNKDEISDEKAMNKEVDNAKNTQTPPPISRQAKTKAEVDIDMEMTKPISTKEIKEINIPRKQTAMCTENDVDDMEITKPISSKEIEEINIPYKHTAMMCKENDAVDMEITEFVPREIVAKKTENCSNIDDMEMTKPVFFQIKSKDTSNQFKKGIFAEENEQKEKQLGEAKTTETLPSTSELTKLIPEALTQLSEETEPVRNSVGIEKKAQVVVGSKDDASEISSVDARCVDNMATKNVTTTPINNGTEIRFLDDKLNTQNDEDVEVLQPQNLKNQEKRDNTAKDEVGLHGTNTDTSTGQDETFDEVENSSFVGKTHEMSFDLKEAENRFNEEQKAWDVKLTNLRSHIDNMKRFLVDLGSREEASENQEGLALPTKRSKLMPSVFETLIPTKDRSHHGHWKIENFDEKEAKFSFFQGTLELILVLGHPSTKKDVKHWAIRRASIMFVTNPPLHPSIKLMQHLFLKEWTNEKLSKVFETTVNISKSLDLFGQSVNEAVRFVLNLDEIKGSHCLFKIEEFQVYVEHFSRPLHLAFAITVDFSQGFRIAKDQGTKLQSLVSSSRGHMISDKTFGNICKNSPSGWNYITHLSTMLDKYLEEMEKDKK